MVPLRPSALTVASPGGLLRELKSELRVCTPIVDPAKPPDRATGMVIGVWDTGASGSVITQSVVDELEIQPIGMTKVHGVAGEHACPVYLVGLQLPMGVGFRSLRVTLGQLHGAQVLIGMDVITAGDFSITNASGVTKMSFRIPSQANIDYVKETNSMGTSRQERRAQERKSAKNKGKGRTNP